MDTHLWGSHTHPWAHTYIGLTHTHTHTPVQLWELVSHTRGTPTQPRHPKLMAAWWPPGSRPRKKPERPVNCTGYPWGVRLWAAPGFLGATPHLWAQAKELPSFGVCEGQVAQGTQSCWGDSGLLLRLLGSQQGRGPPETVRPHLSGPCL